MELDQAWLRLAVAIFVLLAVVFWRRPDRAIEEAPRALWFIVGFILFATTIVLWILSVPRPSPVRRMLGIAADNAAITYAMLTMGEPGAVVFGVYLFLAFGNGFRYGRAYLYFSQVLALVGFGLVLSISDSWHKHLSIGAGLVVMLIILPFYVGELAEQLRARHLKTEQALNECLEREQRKT
jgi:two-component system sensor histidine kinase RpfC